MESFADPEGRQWYLAARAPLSANLASLAAYLQQQGMEHRINEERGSQAIWVARVEAVAQVTQLLDDLESGRARIVEEPKNAVRAQDPSAQTAAVGDQASQHQSSQAPQEAEWSKFLGHGQLALQHVPFTCILLLLSLAGWLLIVFEPRLHLAAWFTFVQQEDLFASPALEHMFTATQPWRLFTPMFLHFSIFHILFNGVILWAFGGRIEVVIGSLRFLLLVAFASMVSNIGQYLWMSDVNFGGMSGVNYAFVGYLWMRQYFSPHPALTVPMSIIWFMLAWLMLGVFGIIDFFMAGGIANGAHVAGLLAGVTWGVVDGWLKTTAKPLA